MMAVLPLPDEIEATKERILAALENRGDKTIKQIAEAAALNPGSLSQFVYGNGSLGIGSLAKLERALIEMGLLRLSKGGKE